LPAWVLPPGCIATPGPAPDLPAERVSTTLTCDGRSIVVTIQAFPPRATADGLAAERRRITGELTAEDTTTAPLRNAGDANGAWSIVQTTGPIRATALAVWTNGAPAQGGIRGRVQQARNSLLGAAHAPILVTATIDAATRLAPGQRRLDDLLRQFVDAQTDLTAQVARLALDAAP
ncbi:MAG: hypothetical protein H7Z10_10550, partial [Gemmatimonadaceae bacterium]|nr:hypothetical protein [Acetobacteraceae bacterium]